MGVCKDGGDDWDDGGKAGGQLPWCAKSHCTQHLDTALLCPPRLVLCSLQERTQQQLDTCTCQEAGPDPVPDCARNATSAEQGRRNAFPESRLISKLYSAWIGILQGFQKSTTERVLLCMSNVDSVKVKMYMQAIDHTGSGCGCFEGPRI